MNQIFLFVAAAVLVESIVTLVKNVIEERLDWKYLASIGAGILIEVLVAVNYGLDVFSFLGMAGKVSVVGAVLTGLLFARGAN